MSERRRFSFNPELDVNTLLTMVVVALLCWIVRAVIQGREDIVQLRTENAYLIATVNDSLPRVEFELRLKAIEVDIQAVRAKTIENETELVKVKRLILAKPNP